MAVNTRIDARSRKNNSFQIQTLDGEVLCTIEAVPNSNDGSEDKFRNEINLRIHTSDKIQLVKSNGVVLRKK